MDFELKDLLRKKEINMPGHSRKYVFSERWKVLIRLILNKNNNLITAKFKDIFIYNFDSRSFQTLLLHLEIDKSDVLCWSKTKKNFFSIICIYFPSLIGHFTKGFNKLCITTDIQLANYNLVKKFKNVGQVLCVQHGYFQVSNFGDIDGLNSDLYVVRNAQQKNLIQEAGYLGDVNIFNPIKKIEFETEDLNNIIFIGPGFSHVSEYEDEIFHILSYLMSTVNFKMSYRPHKRCSKELLFKLSSAGICIDSSEITSLSTSSRRIFLGVKSTMLLDAQEMGHSVILIRSSILPQYFPHGVIKNEILIEDINKINTILCSFA
ncbi:hypothetical protein OAA80_00885 [Amylibacter sp.]|nr:hypothetical protein [Amylibacter sp.]